MVLMANLIGSLYIVLFQRVLSVNVPSEQRNSVYSILSSISVIFQVLMLPIIGNLIDSYGMAFGVGIILILSIIGSIFIFVK